MAAGESSTPHTWASGRQDPRATGTQPLPEQRSSRAGEGRSSTAARAASTSSSVSGRGMSTPGPTWKGRPKNSHSPSRYWRGSPASRRSTRARYSLALSGSAFSRPRASSAPRSRPRAFWNRKAASMGEFPGSPPASIRRPSR